VVNYPRFGRVRNKYAPNTDTNVRIDILDNRIEASIDGESIFAYPIEDRELSEGSVALYSWGSEGVSFDNVRVLDLEPLNIIPPGSDTSDTLIGTDGRDVIKGSRGRDQLTGNGGNDIFVYTSLQDGLDTILDFEVGSDRLDLSALLDGINYLGSDPIGDSYLKFIQRGDSTILQVDPDGLGAARAVSLAVLNGVSATELAALANFII
jgi:hypothetical protein